MRAHATFSSQERFYVQLLLAGFTEKLDAHYEPTLRKDSTPLRSPIDVICHYTCACANVKLLALRPDFRIVFHISDLLPKALIPGVLVRLPVSIVPATLLRFRTLDRREYRRMAKSEPEQEQEGPVEIAIAGDLTENESTVTEKLLEVEPEGECILYFDCPGGSAYCAISLLTIIATRRLNATGIVTGECSSAALWPLAACQKRFVTPFSVLLFHPMKWQSEEHVQLKEAAEWTRHFAELEESMDRLLARFFGMSDELLAKWVQPGRYVTGTEFVEAGLAEMIDLESLAPRS